MSFSPRSFSLVLALVVVSTHEVASAQADHLPEVSPAPIAVAEETAEPSPSSLGRVHLDESRMVRSRRMRRVGFSLLGVGLLGLATGALYPVITCRRGCDYSEDSPGPIFSYLISAGVSVPFLIVGAAVGARGRGLRRARVAVVANTSVSERRFGVGLLGTF